MHDKFMLISFLASTASLSNHQKPTKSDAKLSPKVAGGMHMFMHAESFEPFAAVKAFAYFPGLVHVLCSQRHG